MGKEIERKFLVVGTGYKALAYDRVEIQQGYLNHDPQRTVRVRLFGSEGKLTVKGLTKGCVREEFEYSVPASEAAEMLELCMPPILSKTRWMVKAPDGHIWEVDEFHRQLAPLTVAEIELSSPDETFVKPDFVGEEVTGDPRYYNSNLSQIPNNGL